jgi:hypothetical protein
MPLLVAARHETFVGHYVLSEGFLASRLFPDALAVYLLRNLQKKTEGQTRETYFYQLRSASASPVITIASPTSSRTINGTKDPVFRVAWIA